MHTFIYPYLASCLFILSAGSTSIVAGERIYGTKITIGPEIALFLNDLILDDFTGNGLPDLITATNMSPQLDFVENEGQGLFGAAQNLDSSIGRTETAWAIASGDFDNDGNKDFVVVLTGTLRIYWNFAGNGKFSEYTDNSLDTIFSNVWFVDMDVQAADMNGDGSTDIVVTASELFDKSTTKLLLLQNDGSGGFNNMYVLAENVQGYARIAIGDFNADGSPDIALNMKTRNMVFVYINNGGGAYERKIVDRSTDSNKAIASGDVNGDGYDDLLCQGEYTTTLYVNNQDGTFQKVPQHELDERSAAPDRRVQIFDVDGDGLMDLVSMAGEIVWQRQTSSDPLTFSVADYINAETAPQPVPGTKLRDERFEATGFAFSDVNGDGIVDFIAAKFLTEGGLASEPSVYAFLGEIVFSSPTNKPSNEPTNTPTKQPIAIVSSPFPTYTPTKQPITIAPTPSPTKSLTKQPSTTTPVTSSTEKPTIQPTISDLSPIQKSFAPSEARQRSTEPTTASPSTTVPVQEISIKFGGVVSAETNFSHVEKVFVDSIQSVLRNSTQLESLLDFQSTTAGFNISTEDLELGLANLTSKETADNGRGLLGSISPNAIVADMLDSISDNAMEESLDSIADNATMEDLLGFSISDDIPTPQDMLDFQAEAAQFNISVGDLEDLANLTSKDKEPADNGRGLSPLDQDLDSGLAYLSPFEPTDDDRFPACLVVQEGNTDEQCRILSYGKFSYTCGEEMRHICCNENQGMALFLVVGTGFDGETGENCFRNSPLYDASVHSISVNVVSAECADIDIETTAQEGSQCIVVEMTMTGPSLDDLAVLKDIVEESTKNGNLDSTIASNNLDAIVTQIKETESPSLAPSSTSTELIDPCPLLTGDCDSCVVNTQCLWCHEGNFCFNSDPGKRMPLPTNDISRFLAPEGIGGCSGIPADGLAAMCTSSSTSVVEDTATMDSGGMPSLSSSRSFVVSAVLIVIFLYVVA